jgi:type IV pilus assembly protein PilZ
MMDAGDGSGKGPPGSPENRRIHDRIPVGWNVDCTTEDTFLYASIANISAMGIFIRTTEPLAVGTEMELSFSPPGAVAFELKGQVAWVNPVRPDGDNPNPGMGVRFVDLTQADRERLVDVVHAIAYLREPS